ncbi:MAG: hypothetical protein M3285_00065, partial [Actinomycetota bacterium]|nr:hypothetical protein [Actinomycetota bacterium]
MDEEQEREEGRPQRPRVVDKRVSARPPDAPNPTPPSASVPADTSGAPPVEEPPATAPPPPAGETPPGVGGHTAPEGESSPGAHLGPEGEVWTPEQEAEARKIAEEIASRPSLDWVLNTAVTLANVAGTKLELGAADDARLAIDALAALVNGLGAELQGAEAPLRQT